MKTDPVGKLAGLPFPRIGSGSVDKFLRNLEVLRGSRHAARAASHGQSPLPREFTGGTNAPTTRYGRAATRGAAYLGDLDALLRQLGIPDAVLLGNSLSGVNAYQFPARHPERVRSLVVEDIGAVLADDASFTLACAGVFPSREALAERVGPRFLPYLEDAFRRTEAGWRLAFDPHDMLASQGQLNGDHWADWLATGCPALLVHGRDSRVTATAMVEEMAARRPNTRLVKLDGGHVVHLDNPAGFADAVRSFLQEL